MAGQFLTGLSKHNKERKDDGISEISIRDHMRSGHFIRNARKLGKRISFFILYCLFSIFLLQEGSTQSKSVYANSNTNKA